LPTEKRLVVSFWTFFKFLGNQGELERTETTKYICTSFSSFKNSFPSFKTRISCLQYEAGFLSY